MGIHGIKSTIIILNQDTFCSTMLNWWRLDFHIHFEVIVRFLGVGSTVFWNTIILTYCASVVVLIFAMPEIHGVCLCVCQNDRRRWYRFTVYIFILIICYPWIEDKVHFIKLTLCGRRWRTGEQRENEWMRMCEWIELRECWLKWAKKRRTQKKRKKDKGNSRRKKKQEIDASVLHSVFSRGKVVFVEM